MAALTAALLALCLWGFKHQQHLKARADWHRPLQVAVVLLSAQEVPGPVRARWEEGLPRLEAWFAGERYRYQPGSLPPVNLHLYGPVRASPAPEFLPPTDGWIDRARHAWSLSRALADLDERAGLRGGADDAHLYVELQPAAEGARVFVEGVGAKDGAVGLVRASVADQDLTLALTALAHELLHCVGATDKYDAAGRAQTPGGLAEPGLRPPFPQSYAEVMVGERPVTAEEGRLPESLEQVRVGPLTAAEVRWIVPGP